MNAFGAKVTSTLVTLQPEFKMSWRMKMKLVVKSMAKFSVNLMDLSTKFEKSSLSSTKWISNPPNICTVNIAIPNAGLANLAQQ